MRAMQDDTSPQPDMGANSDADARTERFVALMNQHQARLGSFVESLVPDYQAAQDVLQDTNLILWRKREDFHEGTNFWAWVCSIAFHEVQHFRRSQSRSKLIFGDELTEQLADVSERRLESHEDRCRLLRICFEKLPERQQATVKQRYSGTVSIGDIARRQNMTTNAISKLLQRARASLLDCMEQLMAQEESP